MVKTTKRPKTPQVSMRGETYERLKKAAQKRGIPITKMLDEILKDDDRIKGVN